MIVVSLLIVANVFLLARALGVGPRTAFAVGLTFAIGTPILTYSCLVFVEPIGALGCVYALRLLHTPTLRTRDLLLVSTCLGVLPWVHARFLLFPPLFLTFLLLRLRRDDATRPRVLAALTPSPAADSQLRGFQPHRLAHPVTGTQPGQHRRRALPEEPAAAIVEDQRRGGRLGGQALDPQEDARVVARGILLLDRTVEPRSRSTDEECTVTPFLQTPSSASIRPDRTAFTKSWKSCSF